MADKKLFVPVKIGNVSVHLWTVLLLCVSLFFDFFEAGYEVEPEFIDFYGEKCIYGDAHGRIFELIF